MTNTKFIAYYRVSTDKQGRSGLGLEAQRKAVLDYLNGNGCGTISEFTEVESGKKDNRPQLNKALAACRLHHATLVIAKLDRLSRNQQFLMGLVNSGVDVVFCDLPDVPPGATGRFILQQMASVAELERGLISERTKAALARSTKKLGGFRGYVPSDEDRTKAAQAKAEKATSRDGALGPELERLKAEGVTSLRALADGLNQRGIPAPRGGDWKATSVKRLLNRIAA